MKCRSAFQTKPEAKAEAGKPAVTKRNKGQRKALKARDTEGLRRALKARLWSSAFISHAMRPQQKHSSVYYY